MKNVVMMKQREVERPTIGDLIRRYMKEIDPVKPFGASQRYGLLRLQTESIAKVYAEELLPSDVIDFCRERRALGAGPATVNGDLGFLRGPLSYAKGAWNLNVTCDAIEDAMPQLKKFNLVSKANVRDRRPTDVEFDLLMDFYRAQNENVRTEVPMNIVMEFAVWSLKRCAEITRLKRSDVNWKDRTVVLRDMKDPKKKKGNDFEFPLLGRAWDLVVAQPVLDPNDPAECIFPYHHKTVSIRHNRACKALGIVNLHFHDLRREGICRMFEAGYGPQEVAAVSGHKNWNTLARIYANKFDPRDLHNGPAALRALRKQEEPRDPA